MRRFSLSRRNRILLGGIPFLFLLLLGSQVNAQWVSVMPPEVSANWELNKIKILSAGNGWAVGADYASRKGILLHFSNGVWTSFAPPELSLDWGLFEVFMSRQTRSGPQA